MRTQRIAVGVGDRQVVGRELQCEVEEATSASEKPSRSEVQRDEIRSSVRPSSVAALTRPAMHTGHRVVCDTASRTISVWRGPKWLSNLSGR